VFESLVFESLAPALWWPAVDQVADPGTC